MARRAALMGRAARHRKSRQAQRLTRRERTIPDRHVQRRHQPLCLAALTLTAATCRGRREQTVAPASTRPGCPQRGARGRPPDAAARARGVRGDVAPRGGRRASRFHRRPGGASLRAEGDALTARWRASRGTRPRRATHLPRAGGGRTSGSTASSPAPSCAGASRGDADRARAPTPSVSSPGGTPTSRRRRALPARVRRAPRRRPPLALRLDHARRRQRRARRDLQRSTAATRGRRQARAPARVDRWDSAALTFAVEYPAGPSPSRARSTAAARNREPAQLLRHRRVDGDARRVALTGSPPARDERRAWADHARRALGRLADGRRPRLPSPASRRSPRASRRSARSPPSRQARSTGVHRRAGAAGFTLRDPRGASTRRAVHAWVARPRPPPPRGYPVVVALNGQRQRPRRDGPEQHDLRLQRRLRPPRLRRGGRRRLAPPMADRAALCADVPDGDGPFAGNGAAAVPPWRSRPPGRTASAPGTSPRPRLRPLAADIDRARVAVTGLSMGGERSPPSGAFDALQHRRRGLLAGPQRHRAPTATTAVGAGPAATLGTSTPPTSIALVARARSWSETGVLDRTFSGLVPPFAADKPG